MPRKNVGNYQLLKLSLLHCKKTYKSDTLYFITNCFFF